MSRMSCLISSVFCSIAFVRSRAFGGSFSNCISSALASTIPTRLFRSCTHFLTFSSSIGRQIYTTLLPYVHGFLHDLIGYRNHARAALRAGRSLSAAAARESNCLK